MADQNKLIAQHPLLYHMAEAGAWANIRQHGLLSTTALLRLFDVSEPQRSAIGSRYPRAPRSHSSRRLRLCSYPRTDSNASGQTGPRSDRHGPSGMVQAVERKGVFLVDRKSADLIFAGQITPGPDSRRTHCLHSFAGRTPCNRDNAISHQLRNRSHAHAQTGFEHLPNDSRSCL